MKVFKTKTGIVLEEKNKFYAVPDEDWNSFINDDNLLQKTEQLAASLKAGNQSLIDDVLPPIGDQQELWACGVTYLRSKVARQEESKASGADDFYARVYDAERPEVFFKSTPHRVVGHKAKVQYSKRFNLGCTGTGTDTGSHIIRKNCWLYHWK